MYKIYKITNRLNGLIYIGCTGCSLNTRLHGQYNKRLTDDIKKYGYNSFTIEAIEKTEDAMKAKVLESKYIQELNATDPTIGYNRADKSAYYQNGITESEYFTAYARTPEIKEMIRAYAKELNSKCRTVSKTEIVEPKPQKTHIVPQIVKDALAGLGFPAKEECTAEEQKCLYNETFLTLYQAYNKITDETKRAEILKQIEQLF